MDLEGCSSIFLFSIGLRDQCYITLREFCCFQLRVALLGVGEEVLRFSLGEAGSPAKGSQLEQSGRVRKRGALVKVGEKLIAPASERPIILSVQAFPCWSY